MPWPESWPIRGEDVAFADSAATRKEAARAARCFFLFFLNAETHKAYLPGSECHSAHY